MIPHPLVVHFPIALLTLYSLVECVRWRRIPFSLLTPIKAFLVVIGSASAFVARFTGELTAGTARNPVLAAHNFWGDVTTWVYAIIALSYLLMITGQAGWLARIEESRLSNSVAKQWLSQLGRLAKKFISTGWIIPLALAGLVAVTVTGALGASMIYGPNVDPIVQIIYQLYGFSS